MEEDDFLECGCGNKETIEEPFCVSCQSCIDCCRGTDCFCEDDSCPWFPHKKEEN